MPAPGEKVAQLAYHDYDRGLTFQWDGESTEVYLFDLLRQRIEEIPLQGAPMNERLGGYLRWFESICQSHIRMRDATGEEVVQGAPIGEAPER